jgi:Mg/Co/Ni transporter MgtE
MVFSIYDPNGIRQDNWIMKSSSPGSYSVYWPTHPGFKSGRYQVIVAASDTGSSMQKFFTLEDIPLPDEIENYLSASELSGILEKFVRAIAANYLLKLSPDFGINVLTNMSMSAASDLINEFNTSTAFGYIDALDAKVASRFLENVNVNHSANIIEKLGILEAVNIFSKMNASIASAIIEEMNSTNGAKVIENIPVPIASEILKESDLDVVVDLFMEMKKKSLVAVITKWMSSRELDALVDVLDRLDAVLLNRVFGGLSVTDRKILYLDLSPEVAATINTDLLPLPDFFISKIDLSSPDGVGYVLTSVVTNLGKVDADPFHVTFTANSTIFGELSISGLDVDASTKISYAWNPLVQGYYSLAVAIDPSDSVMEIDETNNEMNTLRLLRLPDLTIEFGQLPLDFTENILSDISVKVSNFGEENVPFSVQLKANEVVVDTWSIQSLDVGSVTTFSFSWIPETSGKFSMEVVVDPLDLVIEEDELNNVAQIGVMVEAGKRVSSLFNPITAFVIIIAAALFLFYPLRNRTRSLLNFISPSTIFSILKRGF